MQGCVVKGQQVPAEMMGELADSTSLLDQPQALRARLQQDGYLLLKRV